MPESMVSVRSSRVELRLRAMRADAPQVAARALHESMQKAFRQSQREVPVRPRGRGPSGTLKNSGKLSEPEVSGSRVTVKISYGGAASAYAKIQHENRTFHHPLGGKAGYIIDPVRDAVPDMRRRMQAALKRLGKEDS